MPTTPSTSTLSLVLPSINVSNFVLYGTSLLNPQFFTVTEMVQLQLSTNSVLEALYTHVESVPYALRCMARELLLALQVTTQYTVHDYDLAPIIARCLIMPYILPALT